MRQDTGKKKMQNTRKVDTKNKNTGKKKAVRNTASNGVNKGKTLMYQTSYHGEKSTSAMTKFFRQLFQKIDKTEVPQNVFDTIPFKQIYPDGLCWVQDDYYSRMVQFQDINYQLAQNEERKEIFEEYCEFLNYFDETIHFQFCFINQKVDMEEYKKIIKIPDQDDAFNAIRKEYTEYLRSQLEKGNNGIVKSKYLVYGIHAKDKKQAVSRLTKIESDIISRFKTLGCECSSVNGIKRLKILHDYMNQDNLESFPMHSFRDIANTGLTPKNFIAPTSFDFRAKDYYKIGDMFATTNYLLVSAPEISDEMLADILNMEESLSVTMHIDSINQVEALKYIKLKLSDINKMKIEEQKKAVRSGYDIDIIPPDIETYSEEAHELLKDMQSRNERMFRLTFLITTFNENLQQMKDFRFTLSNNIQSARCILRKLDHQQEQGFCSSLPLGINFVKQNRSMTTTATAGFVPFTTQELFMDSPESVYMGLNPMSNGIIMADRKCLKNPNGLILGIPGAGKSMSTKREIVNVFLATKDDILICDPEAEYYPLVNYLHGQVIKIGQSSKQYINPLDINLNYSEDDDPVSLKADFILSFMELIVGGTKGLEPEEMSVIDFSVARIYERYFANPKPENMPILQDLYDELRSQKDNPVAQHVAQCMYLYVEGSNNLFNHRTNVDLNNRIICFDIQSLGKTLKKLGMLVVQDTVWNRVTINRGHKETRFYIDEFHLLLKDPLTAAYSMEFWKRFRKWGGIPTGITQNVKDLLASKEIETIFDNTDFVYMLSQGSDDRDTLASKLHISPQQLKYITNAGPGEGLIYFAGIIQPFADRIPQDTLMYSLLTTKPSDLKTNKESEYRTYTLRKEERREG